MDIGRNRSPGAGDKLAFQHMIVARDQRFGGRADVLAQGDAQQRRDRHVLDRAARAQELAGFGVNPAPQRKQPRRVQKAGQSHADASARVSQVRSGLSQYQPCSVRGFGRWMMAWVGQTCTQASQPMQAS